MSWKEYHDWLEGLESPPPLDFKPSWNVAPTVDAPICRIGDDGEREIVLARWWLVPRWHKKPVKEWKASTFNARIEKAATAPTFRTSWKDRRCLVPAQGWYEWTGPKGGKVPWYFRIETNAPGICFAGLWDRSYPAGINGEPLDSFTIMTTEPNEVAAEYHNRMPVVLDPTDYEEWLQCTADDPLMMPADRLRVHQVAPLKGNGPNLIEPC